MMLRSLFCTKSNCRPNFRYFLSRILIFLSIVLNSFCEGAVNSLYKDRDHILELTTSTFNSTVYNKPTAFFVEFYSSWCGHCIDYAPHYVKLATLMKDWNSVVTVAAVNCADEQNSLICREHEIDAFPTLKYFKVYAKSKEDNHRFTDDKKNMALVSKTVAGWAKEDFDREKPLRWPRMELTQSQVSLTDLWSHADSKALFLGVVVENDPANYGYSMMINYEKDPRIHIAVITSTHPIATQFGGVVIPALHLFAKESPQQVLYSSNSAITWIEMKNETDKFLEKAQPLSQIEPVQAPKAMELAQEPALMVNWKQFEVQYLDLTSAMWYMLTQEVPRKPQITGKELEALRGWVHLLRKYAPGSAPLRRLFHRLDEWLRNEHNPSLASELWLNKLEEIQSELGHPLPTNMSYVSCRGSKPYLRGYTCGLWTLFHVLTVQAYEEEKENIHFKPLGDVLDPIRQFIVQFLSCEVCATNFGKMATTNQLDMVTKSEDAVLWLWKAHNNVNKRLKGEKSEDPSFPKQQFPPANLCPQCIVNGQYDDRTTLDFLLKYYSDIKTDNVRPESVYQVKEFVNGKLEKVANKHLNPKFAAVAGKVGKMEELEVKLKTHENGPKRQWKNLETDNYANDSGIVGASADRITFYLIWLAIVGLALGLAFVKYRQNRSKFWKTFYYYNDYKLLPWNSNATSVLRKYSS